MLSPTLISAEAGIAEVHRFLQMGRGDEAEAAARRLQRQYPARGDVNEALALTLINIGKLGEAFPYAEAAVKAEPRNAGYLINLGRLYLRAELIEEALPVLEKAFRVDPRLYQAPWAMGEFFNRAGSGTKAVKYFRQALAACPPDKRSEIELMLADCLSSLGEVDEAERMYLRLAENPAHRGQALAHAANLRKHGVTSEMYDLVRQEIGKGGTPSPHQTELHLALGRMHENDGDYDAAYRHYGLAKETQPREFSLEEFRQRVDDLIGAFTPELIRSFEGYGDPSNLPVFVVGMPRSGTTLTEQIIAAHPKGGGAGELRRISWMWLGLSESKTAAHAFRKMRDGGPQRCRDLASRYVSMLRFLAPGASRVVDKMPHNFLAIGFIAVMFPKARIVHCMRNPADNFMSAFQNHMNAQHSYAFAPEDYAAYYHEYLRLMRHWRGLLPDRIFDLRYEDMTADPEATARALLEFLKLPWDSRCLRFHETGSMVKTFSRQQVRSPVNRASVEKWRNYAAHLAPLTGALRQESADNGYQL